MSKDICYGFATDLGRRERSWSCKIGGKHVERDGQWYCWMHDPKRDRLKARPPEELPLLLPCPFCGSAGVYALKGDRYDEPVNMNWYVVCSGKSCSVSVRTVASSSQKYAASRWNRRYP